MIIMKDPLPINIPDVKLVLTMLLKSFVHVSSKKNKSKKNKEKSNM